MKYWCLFTAVLGIGLAVSTTQPQDPLQFWISQNSVEYLLWSYQYVSFIGPTGSIAGIITTFNDPFSISDTTFVYYTNYNFDSGNTYYSTMDPNTGTYYMGGGPNGSPGELWQIRTDMSSSYLVALCLFKST